MSQYRHPTNFNFGKDEDAFRLGDFRLDGPDFEDPALDACERHCIFLVEVRYRHQRLFLVQLESESPTEEDALLTEPDAALGSRVPLFPSIPALERYLNTLPPTHPQAARLTAWIKELAPLGEPSGFEFLNLDHLPLFVDQLREVTQLTQEDEEDLVPFLFRYGELVHYMPDPAANEAYVADPNVNLYLEAFFESQVDELAQNPGFDIKAFRQSALDMLAFFCERVRLVEAPVA